MKLVKLSLVAAIAAGSFSALNAVSLEDSLRDIDVSGELRYRYDTGRFDSGTNPSSTILSPHNISDTQKHRFRARIGATGLIADNFKVFGQLEYANDRNGGYDSYASGSNVADTDNPFNLRQAYLQYDTSTGFSALLGRQELGSIWTSDMVGVAAKGLYTGIDGLTLAAFAVDGFDKDGDRALIGFGQQYLRGEATKELDANGNVVGYTGGETAVATSSVLGADGSITTTGGKLVNIDDYFYKQNLYGAAAIGSFDLGFGTLDPQLWLGYLQNRAFLYAFDAKYKMAITPDWNWGLQFSYLGNSVDSDLVDYVTDYVAGVKDARYVTVDGTKTGARMYQDMLENGSLFSLKGTLDGYGFDAALGGLVYGKEGKVTVNTIEDASTGNVDLIDGLGEVFYSTGSDLTNSVGKNTFGYLRVGYTFADAFRIGARVIYGGTKTGFTDTTALAYGGGKKTEFLVDARYNYSKALNFSAWYSNLSVDADVRGITTDKSTKDTVRLQAQYKF